MVGVFCSYRISEYIAHESFFEMLSVEDRIELKKKDKGNLLIKHVLEKFPKFRNFNYLTLTDVQLTDIFILLQSIIYPENEDSDDIYKYKKCLKYIPVVDSNENMNLLFTINLYELKYNFQLNFGMVTQLRESNEIQPINPKYIQFRKGTY